MAKQKRKYGLFFKSKDGRWIRLYPKVSFFKDTAIKVFQNHLLSLSFRGKEPALRPLKS